MSDPDDTAKQRSSVTPASVGTSDLAARIRLAQEARAARSGGAAAERAEGSAMGRGLRIGAEFAAAILVGSGIGYLIDLAAGTSPWGLLIMFMVGFAAGILNVTRVVAAMNTEGAASLEADQSTEGRDRGE